MVVTRSAVLVQGTTTSTEQTLVYKVPPGVRAIVKTISLNATVGAGFYARIWARREPPLWQTILVVIDITSVPTHFIETWVILHAGDSLVLECSSTDAGWWVSGTELEIPAGLSKS